MIRKIFTHKIRRFLVIIIPSILSALLFWLDNADITLPKYALPFGFVAVFGLYYLVDNWNRHVLDINVVDKLRKIINSTSRDNSQITTIKNFLGETEEEKLDNGDIVYILTNSIRHYDTSPAAINVIAKNLSESVKYVYFVKFDDYSEFEQEKSEFITLLTRHKAITNNTILDKYLVFIGIPDPSIYNFAIVINRGATIGYWYQTIPDENEIDKNSLVITTLNPDNTTSLLNIFKMLESNGKPVNTFAS